MTPTRHAPARAMTLAVATLATLICVNVANAQRPARAGQAETLWVATWGTAQLPFRAPTPATPPAPAAASASASAAAPAAAPAGAPAAAPAVPPAQGVDPRRRFPIPPAIPGVSNQTVRMIVRTSIGGQQVRVRLSQAFGAAAVTIGAAHIAIRDKDSAIVAGSGRSLTFGGRPTATLYAGLTLVSDPVSLDFKPLADLAVSLYLPGESGPPTNHVFGLRPTYISKEGNFADAATIADPARVTESYYWLSGIDVAASGAGAGTIVTFGDSITDGDQSSPDGITMWPAVLAARLQANPATRQIGVVNAGISGNRILGDNSSGLARFVLHAVSVPGVKWITLMEGINDITNATRTGAPMPPALSADDLIAAYRQAIAIAHQHGVKVIGCTLTPYGGSRNYNEAGEAIRQAANAWIRTGGAFDAVVDFDAVVRDPKRPAHFRPEADTPDDLHPGDRGYRMMAEAIPLTIFTAR